MKGYYIFFTLPKYQLPTNRYPRGNPCPKHRKDKNSLKLTRVEEYQIPLLQSLVKKKKT